MRIKELFDEAGNHMSRKADSWDDVKRLPTRIQKEYERQLSELHQLPLPAEPCNDIGRVSEVTGPFKFVGFTEDSQYFLVDTSGYTYARYAARIDKPADVG